MVPALLLNPSPAGRPRTQALFSRFKELFSEGKVFEVQRAEADSTERHLEKILSDKFDTILVAGGDGTLNRAVNFLHRKNAFGRFSLGILPLGTCNDFARFLGLKAGEFEKVFQNLIAGRTKEFRTATVNGKVFINNAGFGRKHPGSVRKGSARTIIEMEPAKIRAEVSGKILEGRFFMMIAANAPYFSGGLHFEKASDPSDKNLEFFFVKAQPKLFLAARLLAGRMGFPLSSGAGTEKISGPRLVLKTGSPISIVTDGEPAGMIASGNEAVFEIASTLRMITS